MIPLTDKNIGIYLSGLDESINTTSEKLHFELFDMFKYLGWYYESTTIDGVYHGIKFGCGFFIPDIIEWSYDHDIKWGTDWFYIPKTNWVFFQSEENRTLFMITFIK